LQKYNFNKLKTGKWISIGLWKYSRHPNYFGEILCWIGIYIFAFSSLTNLDKLIALISPAYIAFLLIFVTGLPPLEKFADEKWGKDKEYQKYKKRTSILIPWFEGKLD
jgi:steroid 5-alpha reductase family enzyme